MIVKSVLVLQLVQPLRLPGDVPGESRNTSKEKGNTWLQEP